MPKYARASSAIMSIIRQSPLTGPNDRSPLGPCPIEKYRLTSALVKVVSSPSTRTVHFRFLFIFVTHTCIAEGLLKSGTINTSLAARA